MNRKLRRVWLASWQYLNQPIFDSQSQAVWKPSRFWYLYKIQFLERCWLKECTAKSHYAE